MAPRHSREEARYPVICDGLMTRVVHGTHLRLIRNHTGEYWLSEVVNNGFFVI